jgi:hypothetical protein
MITNFRNRDIYMSAHVAQMLSDFIRHRGIGLSRIRLSKLQKLEV